MRRVIEKSEEKEILSLYRAGHSQKDISAQLKITPPLIRNILRENGFKTRNFRALNETVTNVILLLVRNGVTFTDIENICDISFHAIRDVVARHNLQYESKRVRNSMPPLKVAEGFRRNRDFLNMYRSGESFCSLCETFNLSNEEILNEFLSIKKGQVRMHKQALRMKIREDSMAGLSATSIAHKYSISMAIVRDILCKKKKAKTVKKSEKTEMPKSAK